MTLLFFQPPWEVHPPQATPIWCLISATAAGSSVRAGSHAENAVSRAFKAASLLEMWAWIREQTPHPISAPHFFFESQSFRICAYSLPVSLVMVSYLSDLPFYSFWAQNQFRELDGKRHHVISPLVLISSSSPAHPLSLLWDPAEISIICEIKGRIPYMWREVTCSLVLIVAEFLSIDGISSANLLHF